MRVLSRRLGGLVGVTAVLLSTGAGVASAHVTVAAPGVSEGQSDATVIFRVPDESASAQTVGLRVQFPIGHPIAGVLVAPVTGWTAKITNTKLAKPMTTDDGTITEVVSEIDWTADAASGIKPGFFSQFTVIAGQLPDGVAKLTFKAIQTYSDNTVVSWIEVPAPGSTSEPDHPAPELTLAPVVSAGSPAPAVRSAAAPVSSGVAVAAGAADSTAASKGSVTTALMVGILGVVVGAIGVGLAITARRRVDAPENGAAGRG